MIFSFNSLIEWVMLIWFLNYNNISGINTTWSYILFFKHNTGFCIQQSLSMCTFPFCIFSYLWSTKVLLTYHEVSSILMLHHCAYIVHLTSSCQVGILSSDIIMRRWSGSTVQKDILRQRGLIHRTYFTVYITTVLFYY